MSEIKFRLTENGRFMKIALLLILFLVPMCGQENRASEPEKKACGLERSADILYRPVVLAMWKQDEGEHPYAVANGFIRIAVHPAFEPEFFFDVLLNRDGSPTVVGYSLPKDTMTVTLLLETALKENPCADVTTLAAKLPIGRRKFTANRQIRELIKQFFTLRLTPRRIPDLVRLDATEYEVEFVGNDTLLFNSDDYEAPMVKWVQSFLRAANAIPEQSH